MADRPAPQLLDPAVNRAKFANELATYWRHASDFISRGWWIVRSDYPSVTAVFGVNQLKPQTVRFAAVLDFQNFDLWPPSVHLVDPFTLVRYKASQLPTRMPRLTPQAQFPGAPLMQQDLVQAYDDNDPPFVCLPGVREYHFHPAHTNDPWEVHRSSGEGRLVWILEKLWEYGVQPVSDFQTNVEIRVNIAGLVQAHIPT